MDHLKQKLTTYAYNITGSYEDARDVVQDVFLEMLDRDRGKIDNEQAYLTRSVINRAINWKKKQQKILSGYPGNWLPEPIATESADALVDQKDILNYSLMVLLEKLTPRQRAVFILKEAFEYEHEEIARFLGITVENCRKILSRAKKELARSPENNLQPLPAGYLEQYMDIIQKGDVKRLEQLLAKEITLVSDGGGKAPAATRPLTTHEQVIAFVTGIYHKFYSQAYFEFGRVNHQPAIFYYVGGQLVTCQILSIRNNRIENIYFMRNPDKLKALQKISA